jgi:aldehyde dehydrogenase (NAD+)
MAVTAPARLDPRALLAEGAHLIGGDWVPAGSGETLDVINPATQEVLLAVPRGRAGDINDAVQAAAAAFPAWRDASPVARAEALYRWADLCRRHEAEISSLESMEVGHPHWGPSPVPRRLTYVAGLADKITGQTLPTAAPGVLGMTVREPFGVCGSIIPWNVPGPIMVTDVAPAIAVGNTIVVKPAEDAPLTCLLIAKLAADAGIPPGVINIVTGYGAEAGAALPAHPLIRRMSFTGSPETGSKIMAACTRYGLNASIWTSDVSRAVRLATSVQAGQVTINGFGSFGVIGAPWGGYKHSGFGRTMSADSVLDYTQLKSIIINAAD